MSFLNKLKSHLPFLEGLPELKYKKVLRADICTGITVAEGCLAADSIHEALM